MRVLICTGIFPPEVGGPATYSELLASAFSKQGHDVKVITYSDESHKSGDDRYPFKLVRITRSWLKAWHYFKYLMAVRNYGRDVDVLYAQDTVSSGYPTYLAAKRFKKPLVVKVTGDYSWERAMNRGFSDKLIDEFQSETHYSRLINRIRRVQIKVCKAADVVITPSNYLKGLVKGWGIDENKIRVVYNAVPAMPEIDREKSRSEIGLSDNDFLVVSAGRKVPWKGFVTLKQSVEELQKSNPGIKLKIISGKPKPEVLKYIKAADVFILNTGYEGFPHLVLEAMALGTPVVTTDVGGNREVVSDGENGLLVEYNNKEQLRDAILKLYKDKTLQGKLADSGKQTVKKFDFATMVNRTEELLKSVMLA